MKDKHLPTVSVCIPCTPLYIQYLDECLSSIAAQSHLPTEVILVISESNATIEKIIMEKIACFKEKLPIFCTFFAEKRCAGSDRNAAVSLARADIDIIVFIDAYDIMYPHRIITIQHIFHDFPETVALLHCFTENEIIDLKKLDMHYCHADIKRYYYQEKFKFSHGSFRPDLLKKYPYQTMHQGEDIDLFERLLPKYADNMLIYEKPLSIYMSMRNSFLSTYSQRRYHLFNMQTRPSVSVCIPCIPKHIEYLDDCFSSIANQSVLPEEVILIVSESTPTLLKKVSDKIAPFSTLLNIIPSFFPKKQYAGTNRNISVKLAECDLIAFMDADDTMYPDKIEILKDIFYTFPQAVGCVHYYSENLNPSDLKKSAHRAFDKKLVDAYVYKPDTYHYGHACYKSTLFATASYTTKHRGQDLEFFNTLLSKHIQNLLIYKAPLSNYISDRSSFYHLDQANELTQESKSLSFSPYSPSNANDSGFVNAGIPLHSIKFPINH